MEKYLVVSNKSCTFAKNFVTKNFVINKAILFVVINDIICAWKIRLNLDLL